MWPRGLRQAARVITWQNYMPNNDCLISKPLYYLLKEEYEEEEGQEDGKEGEYREGVREEERRKES